MLPLRKWIARRLDFTESALSESITTEQIDCSLPNTGGNEFPSGPR
jgi:hypothetical protein